MPLSGLLGKKNSNGRPHINSIVPGAALPGGEVRIEGASLRPSSLHRPHVLFGEDEGYVVISSDQFVVARVPENASGPVIVRADEQDSNEAQLKIAVPIADSVHPVTNPAVDSGGNIFVTYSGSRGQKVPVSIYKIDPDFNAKAFVSDLMNATSIAFDRTGQMFVSSRFDGTVYRVAANGAMTSYAQGMGTATGIAFDKNGDLYVGDRSGTIFKINRSRDVFVFATLEPSVSAYHLAFAPNGDLYVSGPTTSSFDAIYKINPQGEVSEFFRGLGRPQGMAFDAAGNLYISGSYAGQRGIVRINPDKQASLAVSGQNTVGIAFGPGKSAIIATHSGVHYLSLGIEGMPLHG